MGYLCALKIVDNHSQLDKNAMKILPKKSHEMTTKRPSTLSGILFFGCLLANILSACHFGDKPDGLAALAKKKRQLTYSMSVALPSIAVSDSAIVDYGPDGLNVNWDEHEKLAVMGSEFLVEKDTIGDALWPYPEALDYNRYRNTDTSVVDNETRIPFEFSAYAKHGIGEEYATLINVVYPYSKVIDRNGNPLKARVDSIPFTFTGQDGTLGTLAKKYHYVYGKATVTSVTDKTADATMPKMKSLLTVCKFSFVDRASSSAIPIKTLAISYGGTGSDAGTYPQTATVAIDASTPQADVHATGVTGSSPLLLEGSGEATAVYVALLPTDAQRTYSFTVTNSSGTYTGTAKATLTEGKYVEATGLKLTKQP